MADRTIKPDDGNDLVLQNNHGNGKIEINEDDTVKITGNVGIGATASVNLHIVADATEGTPSFAGATHFAVQATASSSDNVNASLISGSLGTSRIMFGHNTDEDPGKIEYDNSTNGMKFFTNTTERMRFDSSGNVELKTSNANLILPSGGGIDFSAQTTSGTSPDTTAGAETISHYEQGTWTPSCPSFAGTTTPSEGHYIKIGDLVYATGLVAFSNTADSDNVNIEGLPFTKKSETRFSMGGFITFTTINFWVSPLITDNKVELYKIDGTNASYDDVKNNQFRFTVIYPT